MFVDILILISTLVRLKALSYRFVLCVRNKLFCRSYSFPTMVNTGHMTKEDGEVVLLGAAICEYTEVTNAHHCLTTMAGCTDERLTPSFVNVSL